jgi:hypothetical protein
MRGEAGTPQLAGLGSRRRLGASCKGPVPLPGPPRRVQTPAEQYRDPDDRWYVAERSQLQARSDSVVSPALPLALVLLFVAWWTWWMSIDIVVDIDVCIGIVVFKDYIDV